MKFKGTYYYEINWGHLKRVNPDANEAWEENYRCYSITNLFNYQTGWNSWNGYGSLSNKNDVQSTVVWRQQNDVWATDFWVGDFHTNHVNGWYETEGWHTEYEYMWIEEYQQWMWWPVEVYGTYWTNYPELVHTDHYSFYGSGTDESQDINDFDLYQWTNYPYSKQMFTFDWTCSCANPNLSPNSPYYGYDDQQYYTGIVGMPLAWTSNWGMNVDGYNYPNTDYCYIGFDGASHPLIDLVDGRNYHYTDFPRAFYEKLLGFHDNGAHQTVKASLDYAAQLVFGSTDWWTSPFSPNVGYDIYVDPFGWQYDIHMQVFGNSGLAMPYG